MADARKKTWARWLGQMLAETDLRFGNASPASDAPVVTLRGIAAMRILVEAQSLGAALPQPPPTSAGC